MNGTGERGKDGAGMCMRFAFRPADIGVILKRFELESSEYEAKPRYNISPSRKVPVIFNDSPKTLSSATWGIPAHWGKEAHKLLLNARAETIDLKPSFKNGFAKRRCLMLADAFYEWKQPEKRPFMLSLKGGAAFAFAGIYAQENDGRACCMITTAPNALVAKIHGRMPAILPVGREREWLLSDTESAISLLNAFPAGGMEMAEISPRINSSKSDSAALVEPVAQA